MTPIRITKRFTFEMAHALRNYPGPCRHIHGHSYVLDVTVSGPLGGEYSPNEGMVMDFGVLKSIVQQSVLDYYDHALVLHEDVRSVIPMEHDLFARTLFTPWQPTCENLLRDMVRRIEGALPEETRLRYARLQETATGWAEWDSTATGVSL